MACWMSIYGFVFIDYRYLHGWRADLFGHISPHTKAPGHTSPQLSSAILKLSRGRAQGAARGAREWNYLGYCVAYSGCSNSRAHHYTPRASVVHCCHVSHYTNTKKIMINPSHRLNLILSSPIYLSIHGEFIIIPCAVV